jgi:SHO1 osmosensor
LAFLAVSISYLTGSIGTFVYSSNGAAAALSAGMIIMIIMQFLWVFIFGAEESSNFTAATAPFNGGGTPMAFLSRNRGEKEEVVDTKSAGHSAPVGSVSYPEMNGHNGGVYQANHPSQALPAGNAPASPGGVASAAPLEYNQQVTALHACK